MTRQTKTLRYLRRAADYMAYAHRPVLWPQMARNIANKVSGRIPDKAELERQKAEASAWCEARCVAPEEVFGKLGLPGGLLSLEEKFPDVLAPARARAGTVPVKMGGASNTDLLYSLCEALQARSVIETGVAYGWSSLAVLLSLKDRQGARLYSIDLPYFERHNDAWVGIAVPEDLRGGWELLRMADREGLPRALAKCGPLDLAHYDSDKSAAGRHYAYPKLWAALRPGGILMSDDIQDNMGFAEYCAQNGLEPVIVRKDSGDYQGLLKKP